MRVRSIILCDDVRTEENRKILIIGAYGDAVICNTRPAAFTGQVFCQLEVQNGKEPFEFELKAGDRKLGGSGAVPDGNAIANMNIPVQVFSEEDTTIEFRFRCGDDAWQEPAVWHVRISPDAREVTGDELKQLKPFLPKKPKSKALKPTN